MVYLIDEDGSRRGLVSAMLPCFGIAVRDFCSSSDFLADFDETRPAVVLFAMQPTDSKDMESLNNLLSQPAMCPVLVLASNGSIDMCRQIMKAGAAEFLPYPCEGQEIAQCLGQCLEVDRKTRERLSAERKGRECFWILTPREREVLALLAAGMTNKEIAWELRMSPRTVEVHRAHIMEKLEMRSFAQLIFSYAKVTTNANSDVEPTPF